VLPETSTTSSERISGDRSTQGWTATAGEDVVDVREAERQTVRLVRGAVTWGDGDGTVTRPATLEEVVLGYLRSSRAEVK